MDKTLFIIFWIYTLLGAILEHISYYIGNTFFNSKPKYLNNPILTGFPLYGLGGLWINYTYKKYLTGYNDIQLFFIFGTMITILEYVIGKMVGAGISDTGVPSWDYSKEVFNFQGIISMRHFISWGLLGLTIIRIQPKLEKQIYKL